MSAGEVLRRIREHERACRGQCDVCQAKRAAKELAYQHQREVEALMARVREAAQ